MKIRILHLGLALFLIVALSGIVNGLDVVQQSTVSSYTTGNAMPNIGFVPMPLPPDQTVQALTPLTLLNPTFSTPIAPDAPEAVVSIPSLPTATVPLAPGLFNNPVYGDLVIGTNAAGIFTTIIENDGNWGTLDAWIDLADSILGEQYFITPEMMYPGVTPVPV